MTSRSILRFAGRNTPWLIRTTVTPSGGGSVVVVVGFRSASTVADDGVEVLKLPMTTSTTNNPTTNTVDVMMLRLVKGLLEPVSTVYRHSFRIRRPPSLTRSQNVGPPS